MPDRNYVEVGGETSSPTDPSEPTETRNPGSPATDQSVDDGPIGPTKTDDPSAPYGRDTDGTLLDKTGARATNGLRKDGLARRKSGPPKGYGAKPPGSTPKPSAKGRTDYRPGVMGITQVPVALLAGVGAAAQNDVLLADAQIIGMSAPGIAEALNDLAQENAQIAGALDRLLKVGPYGALTMAVLPMCVQIGVNHGLIPRGLGKTMGAVYDPQDLADAAKSDLAQMAESNGQG